MQQHQKLDEQMQTQQQGDGRLTSINNTYRMMRTDDDASMPYSIVPTRGNNSKSDDVSILQCVLWC
jgi:hypothetical protein